MHLDAHGRPYLEFYSILKHQIFHRAGISQFTAVFFGKRSRVQCSISSDALGENSLKSFKRFWRYFSALIVKVRSCLKLCELQTKISKSCEIPKSRKSASNVDKMKFDGSYEKCSNFLQESERMSCAYEYSEFVEIWWERYARDPHFSLDPGEHWHSSVSRRVSPSIHAPFPTFVSWKLLELRNRELDFFLSAVLQLHYSVCRCLCACAVRRVSGAL